MMTLLKNEMMCFVVVSSSHLSLSPLWKIPTLTLPSLCIYFPLAFIASLEKYQHKYPAHRLEEWRSVVGNYGIPKDYHLQVRRRLVGHPPVCTHLTCTQTMYYCFVGLTYHLSSLLFSSFVLASQCTPFIYHLIDTSYHATIITTANQATFWRFEDASRLLRDFPAESPSTTLRRTYQCCGHGNDRFHGGGRQQHTFSTHSAHNPSPSTYHPHTDLYLMVINWIVV